jgi:hypothetical protein
VYIYVQLIIFFFKYRGGGPGFVGGGSRNRLALLEGAVVTWTKQVSNPPSFPPSVPLFLSHFFYAQTDPSSPEARPGVPPQAR